MAADEFIEALDEYLDGVQDQVLRDLVARGHRLCEVQPAVAQIRDSVRTRFVGSAATSQQLGKELTDAVVTQVMAQGLRLSARLVSNTLAVRGRLNQRQAICLWLGLFAEQSSYGEGLWQMYVDFRAQAKGAPLSFPEEITNVCGPIEAEGDPTLQDRILDFWEEQLEQANRARSGSGKPALEPEDIPSLIAWVLATRLDGQSPDALAEGLERGITGVYNDLRRGYHTLFCKYLEDIYGTIDLLSSRVP